MTSLASSSITEVIKIYADLRFFQQFKATLHILIAFVNLLNIPDHTNEREKNKNKTFVYFCTNVE